MDMFPNNTLTEFLVNLERPLRLDGHWWVGLVAIHFPNSWNNVTDGRIIVSQKASANASVMFIKNGRYRTIEELINAIHLQLSTFQHTRNSIR